MNTINARTIRMKTNSPEVRFGEHSTKCKTTVNKSERNTTPRTDSVVVALKRMKDFISQSHPNRQHSTKKAGSSITESDKMSLYLKVARCPRSDEDIYRGLQQRILDALKENDTETEERNDHDTEEPETTQSRSFPDVNDAEIMRRPKSRPPTLVNDIEIPKRSKARSLSARYEAVVPPPYRVPLQWRYPLGRRQGEIEVTRAANQPSYGTDVEPDIQSGKIRRAANQPSYYTDVEPDIQSGKIRADVHDYTVPHQIDLNASALKSVNEQIYNCKDQHRRGPIGTSEACKRRGSAKQNASKDTSTRIPFCAYEDFTRQRIKSATSSNSNSSSRTSRSYDDIKGEFLNSVSANLKRTQGMYDDVFKARRKFGNQLMFLGKKIDNRDKCPRSVLSKDMRQRYTDIKNEYLRLCGHETKLKNQITKLHSEIYMIQNKGYGYQKQPTSLTVITFDPNTSDLSCPSTRYPLRTPHVKTSPKTSSIINDTHELEHAQKQTRPKSPTRNSWIYREDRVTRKAKTPTQGRARKNRGHFMSIKQPVVELVEAPLVETVLQK